MAMVTKQEILYINDVAEVIEKIIELELNNNNVYNVSTGNTATVNELAKTVIGVIGGSIIAISYVRERPGHEMQL